MVTSFLVLEWNYFGNLLRELCGDHPDRASTIKYEVVLLDIEMFPTINGAINQSCLLSLLYHKYHIKDDHTVTPLNALLLILNSRFYSLCNTPFLAHCQRTLASNMDATQIIYPTCCSSNGRL